MIRVNKGYIYRLESLKPNLINLGLGGLGTRHSRPKPWRTARLGPLSHKYIYMSNTPRSLIVGSLNVQTGPELYENRRWKTLGEVVGVL